jgi:hypothetical protein
MMAIYSTAVLNHSEDWLARFYPNRRFKSVYEGNAYKVAII